MFESDMCCTRRRAASLRLQKKGLDWISGSYKTLKIHRIASIHAAISGSLRNTITIFVHRFAPARTPAAYAPLPLAAFGASIRMQYSNPSLMFLVRLTVAALSNATTPLATPDASSEMKGK
jgi:hypothetical protein